MSNQVKSLIASFRYAARGVAYCVNNERNMRIHLVTAAYIVVFSRFYDLSVSQFALMICAIALVVAMEMVNTAVEVLVNLESPAYNSLARIAKDVAAGAVLVCAIFALAIGLLLFWRPSVLLKIGQTLCANPVWGGLFLLSIPLALVFIFVGPARIWRWLARQKTER